MEKIIYTERGRRELGALFCWYVEHGESDRNASRYSELPRRTFARWCRQSPSLAARYARAVEARAALYRRRKVELRKRLASSRRLLRRAPAKSDTARALRQRVEEQKQALQSFTASACCVRLTAGRKPAKSRRRARRH